MSSFPDSDGEDDRVRIGWQPDATKLRGGRRDTSSLQAPARPALRGDMIAAAAAPPAHARGAAPSRGGGVSGGAAPSFDFLDAFREAPPSDSDAERRAEAPSEEDDAMPWSDGEAADSPQPQQLPPSRSMAAAHSAPAARTAARTGATAAGAMAALAPRRASGVVDSQTPYAAAHTPRGSNVIRGAALDFGDDDDGEEVAAPAARTAARPPAQRPPPPPQARRGDGGAAAPARRNARDALVRRPRRGVAAAGPPRPQLSIREDPAAEGTGQAPGGPLPLAARLRLLSAQAAAPQPRRRSDAGGGSDGSDDVDDAMEDDDDAAAGGADLPAPPGATPGARGAFAARLPRTEAAAPGAAPPPRRTPQGASLVARLAAVVSREKQRRLAFERALAAGEAGGGADVAHFRVVSQRRDGAALALWAAPACAAAAAAAGGADLALLVLPAAAAATSALRLGAGATLRAHPPWMAVPLRGGKGNALLLSWNVSQ